MPTIAPICIAVTLGGLIAAAAVPSNPTIGTCPAPQAASAPLAQPALAAAPIAQLAPAAPGAPSKGITVSVSSSPTRHITSDPDEEPAFTVEAKVTNGSKKASGKVVFYDGKTKLDTVKLKKGKATLDLPADLSFGKHTIKAIHVPTKAGAKKTAGTTDLYWQKAASATFRVNGDEVPTSDTTVIKKGKTAKFSATFTKDDGSKITGRAIVYIYKKKGDSWTSVKTTKVTLKGGKSTVSFKNTLGSGTEGKVSWTLNGGWGVSRDLYFASGKLPAGSSGTSDDGSSPSPTSTNTPRPAPTSPMRCGYECVQYGTGYNFAGQLTYGCMQQVYICK
jgi:hypothetical protein